jgi:response regulator RpfG family c-di-GMP phosphodiesterase
LKEQDVKMMARCIALDRDCAKICFTASAMMASGSEFADEICRVCAEVCRACGEECRKHKHMEHCQRCAEACERCAQECERMGSMSKVTRAAA